MPGCRSSAAIFGLPVEDNVLDVPRDRNYRTPQDDATSRDHNLQLVFARQLAPAWGFRNTLSYRHFNDEYFLSEGLTFDPPSTILRDYLYFHHHRRPLTNLAEVTGRVTRGVEQNLVFGWEGQRYHNYTTLPENDFFSADADRCVQSRRDAGTVRSDDRLAERLHQQHERVLCPGSHHAWARA